jgi:hypothetical protein
MMQDANGVKQKMRQNAATGKRGKMPSCFIYMGGIDWRLPLIA